MQYNPSKTQLGFMTPCYFLMFITEMCMNNIKGVLWTSEYQQHSEDGDAIVFPEYTRRSETAS